jgi:hypothetical protein
MPLIVVLDVYLEDTVIYFGETRGQLINKHCDIGIRSFNAPNTKGQDCEVRTRTAHHNLSA